MPYYFEGIGVSLLVLNIVAFGLATMDLIGNYQAGSHKRVGWLTLFVYKALWCGYAFVTAQYAFIPFGVVLGIIMARNFIIRKGQQ